MALHEHTVIDPQTGRYMKRRPVRVSRPGQRRRGRHRCHHVDEPDDHLNPIGVKGLGELATTGVAAAVANAVYHATGVRVRDLPITLDKVLRLTPPGLTA